MTVLAKSTFISILRILIAGLQKNLSGQTLVVNNVTTKVDDLVTTFEGWEAQVIAIDAAFNEWKRQVTAFRATQKASMNPQLLALRHALKGMYGVSNQTLADFGIKPNTPHPRTGKTNVAAAEKAAATRVARHTLGS